MDGGDVRRCMDEQINDFLKSKSKTPADDIKEVNL